MDSFPGASLPLASLRLLIPPVQLMAASMWQVVMKKEVMSFWNVAEFVSLVIDIVPELLIHKHSTQLIQGFRARYILELCKNEQAIKQNIISSYLDRIKSTDMEGEEQEGMVTFTKLICLLLEDAAKRRDFFLEVFPAQFGTKYDKDLQTLFWEFLYRLTQLLPVPDLQKAVSWLGSEYALYNKCGYSSSELADLKILLQHHRNLGHLKEHVPPSNMGENIFSSLCGDSSSVVKPPITDPLPVIYEDMQNIFVDDVAVDEIAVTDYAEVELSSTARFEDVGNSCSAGSSINAPAVSSTKSSKDRQDDGEKEKGIGSPVKVRASGRVRRPTMKIQVNTLQKCMATKRRMETSSSTTSLKSVAQSTEHSYGSSEVSSKYGKDFDEVVQQHTDIHSSDIAGKMSPLQDPSGLFSCLVCKKSFKFHCLLKAHQRSHTGEQPFLCNQCGRRFSFKQSLERHKHTHKTGRKSLAAHKKHQSTRMENCDHRCAVCCQAFACKSALLRHMKSHRSDAEQGEEPYKCTSCDLSFSCAGNLGRHLQTHQEEKDHTCNCGKSFAHRSGLAAHQRIHWKERPHTCAQCGKGFIYKSGLLSHMKIHSEEKPFMCSFCGKSFKRERNMKTHEHCHTRENVFSCSQCDKSFVYKATLTRHELTHSGERPYLCSDCGKGFFSHAELLKHERFHTGHKPFQCPHCGKQFTQSCYLTVHMRYHTGVRPYSCTQCDKSFLSANRLKRHQKIHSDEKTYLCVECGKGFRQSYNLKMHQKTHSINLTENSV